MTLILCNISGEDSKHCLSELNTHGPTVKGWQSERNSTYPQEIILQLDRRAKLSKIQVLVHQYLICKQNTFIFRERNKYVLLFVYSSGENGIMGK